MAFSIEALLAKKTSPVRNVTQSSMLKLHPLSRHPQPRPRSHSDSDDSCSRDPPSITAPAAATLATVTTPHRPGRSREAVGQARPSTTDRTHRVQRPSAAARAPEVPSIRACAVQTRQVQSRSRACIYYCSPDERRAITTKEKTAR